ncbi:hypothetical protein [uncultured Ruegeria sp.]|uniref:hypothetical protein n=1 Tax=uncultured Ruegeria sp. TaxID=259304 RepID=UPI00261EFA61|nr:hypothetical protein [uncultured Ruegeria sp.]
MMEDLSKTSRRDRKRIARMAKRNVGSEIVLILTAGFSLLMIVTFYFGVYTFLPLAEVVNVRPTIVWVALSFGTASICAFIHAIRMRPKVERARELDAAFLYEYQQKRNVERAEKS